MAEQDLAEVIKGMKDLALRIDESRNETQNLALKIEETRNEMRERFEQVDTQIRRVGVQVEDVRGDIAQVAESVGNVDEKLDRHVKENEQQFADVHARIQLSHSLLMKRDDALDARLTILESSRR
jgi:uncharacterized protein YoxC